MLEFGVKKEYNNLGEWDEKSTACLILFHDDEFKARTRSRLCVFLQTKAGIE